jgi:peptidoglycan-associated lipoprotein
MATRNVAMDTTRAGVLAVVLAACLAVACGGNKRPAVTPMPNPAPVPPTVSGDPPPPPRPLSEATVVAEPVREDRIASSTLDDLNRNSPLKPVFFELDSFEISGSARTVLEENAAVLKKYGTWAITIEGHCDERGTAEYNLALGERRALAARAFLVTQGIAPDRLRTVSYGNEFPFDQGHDENAFAKNRRAHFVITSK